MQDLHRIGVESVYSNTREQINHLVDERDRLRDELDQTKRQVARARARVSERGRVQVREEALVQRIRDTEELERRVKNADVNVLPVPVPDQVIDWDTSVEEFWCEYSKDVRMLIGERDGLKGLCEELEGKEAQSRALVENMQLGVTEIRSEFKRMGMWEMFDGLYAELLEQYALCTSRNCEEGERRVVEIMDKLTEIFEPIFADTQILR
jgi:hypothetical protein